MQFYCENLLSYQRLRTRPVTIGSLVLGDDNPVRIQTMTTTDTMETDATVAQSIRCFQAGAELVRITAPSKNEAENLKNIKADLVAKGYPLPLVADIHFTPNAAEIAAGLIEKVRVNPGNYVDKKKFEQIEYTDEEYAEEIERIRERFTPLVLKCKAYGTAMRIGTNHGSLSDRIMSRYGDTAMGMVESAMEFLRIARQEDYHQIVLSMKSSNPLVMVQAYRLLVNHMESEFGECYPLHLGVTEAGDGEDGRIKSAIGIGALLQDGLGDTIRVSLTEDPEFEIPVCQDIIKRFQDYNDLKAPGETIKPFYDPFNYSRRVSHAVSNIGTGHVPVVIADFMQAESINPEDLDSIGYRYINKTDKWHVADAAADIIYTGSKMPQGSFPSNLGIIVDADAWHNSSPGKNVYPLYQAGNYSHEGNEKAAAVFVAIDANAEYTDVLQKSREHSNIVYCIYANGVNSVQAIRRFFIALHQLEITHPVVLAAESHHEGIDEQLIHFSIETGALFLDGMGDGIWLMNDPSKITNAVTTGRTNLVNNNNHQFLNNTAFSILQAVRTRISKTEYISCPSCGRTLFDLQETTTRIRSVTQHLKGLKIAVMGCIVNGPGEMADADFGYVGSGPGKITLYKGKEVMQRNINSEVAVDELINLLKANDCWIEPA